MPEFSSPVLSIICVANESTFRFHKTLGNLQNKVNEFNEFGLSSELIIKLASRVELAVGLSCKGQIIKSKDTGIYEAMNQALAHSKGRYVIFINCGDTLLLDPRVISSLTLESDAYLGKFLYNGKVKKNSRYFRYNGKSLCHQSAIIKNRSINYDTNYLHISDYIHFLSLKSIEFIDVLVAEYGAEVKTKEYVSRGMKEKVKYFRRNHRYFALVITYMRLFKLKHDL